jgi:hypothetical protein
MGNARRAARARMMRRRRIAATILALAVLVGGGAAYYYYVLDRDGGAVTGEQATESESPAPNLAAGFEGGESSLLYVDFAEGKALRRVDLETGVEGDEEELPKSGDTTAALGSQWISIVTPEEQFDDVRPALYIYDPETGVETFIGVHEEPVWSASGDHLAFLTPDVGARCSETSCRGDKVVSVIDPEAPDDVIALTEPGPYTMEGWLGEDVLVSNESIPGVPVLQSISLEKEVTDIPVAPKDFWEASPDGRYVISSGSDGTLFYEIEDGELLGEGIDIAIPEGSTLGSGAWAHDSSQVAALSVDETGALQMVRFSPDDPTPQLIDEGGDNASVKVMWAPENDAIVFSRLAVDELEAVHCEVEDPDSCEVLFSWTLGISLLRIE